MQLKSVAPASSPAVRRASSPARLVLTHYPRTRLDRSAGGPAQSEVEGVPPAGIRTGFAWSLELKAVDRQNGHRLHLSNLAEVTLEHAVVS